MLSLYVFPEAARVFYSVLALGGAGLTALALVMHLSRFRHGPAYPLAGAAFVLLLCQAVINVALIAQMQANIADGFIVQSGYEGQRYAVFAAAVILFIILIIMKKPLIPGVAVIVSLLTLPLVEERAGSAFPFWFLAALLLLAGCGLWLSVKYRKELSTSISGVSVKQAMDSLGEAIMFYGKDGHILMQNDKMRELMVKTAGRAFFNGRLYLESVVVPESESGEAGTGPDGSYVLRLPDSVWLFSAKELSINGKAVTRITAADVSEQDKAAAMLKEKHAELKGQRERLRALVENIEEIRRTEEQLRIKTKIHDEQNKKMAMLLGFLRYGELPDGTSYEVLRESLLRGMREEGDPETGPEETLDIVALQYGLAGVSIILNGALPQCRGAARAFAQIISEAAANAVRHGYANEVRAEITHENDHACLRVTDNSALPPKEVREGSGIAGMRSMAEGLGGSLTVGYSPGFTLTAIIPVTVPVKGESDE